MPSAPEIPRAEPAAGSALLKVRRVRPWFVLLAGFGGLLLLMAAAGTGSIIMLDKLRSSDSAVRQRFLSRGRALEQIRTHIYLSGTYVRDFLLAPEPSVAQVQKGRLEALRQESEASLIDYEHRIDPEERAPFQELKSEIEAYWRVLDRTFAWTREERDRERYAFFYDELIPRRTAMLQIADRVAAVNERELNRSDDQLARTFDRFRIGLLASILVTIVGGMLVSGLTITYMLRLERELRMRLDETAAAQIGLKELSAKLVRAQEDERRALSRELHDEVGQSFSAILMETENLLDIDDSQVVRPHLESVRGLAEKGVQLIRNMALLLRPSMLDDFGLLPALNWQARETAKRSGLKVNVNAELNDELPEEHKTCIYRIVQEALNNSVRHARAHGVQITVQGDTHKILLTVQDDGTGFDTRWVRGLGILGMEERVKHLGGAFHIESRPGLGTLVKVELPVAGLNGKAGAAANGNGSHSHTAG